MKLLTVRRLLVAVSLSIAVLLGTAIVVPDTKKKMLAKTSAQARRTAGGGKVFQSVGVALTPVNFPNHSAEDVRGMFQKGREVGDVAVFIYQWGMPNFKQVARDMMKASADAGLTPVIGLSPTMLTGMRGELDVPAEVRRKAGRKLSFTNRDVHLPFIADALDLARLQPPYLCLATEINLLAFKSINEYVAFAAVYKKLYPEIKKVSPQTQVFVSFQWDFFQIMATKEPNRISEHKKLIDIFHPEMDLVALTSYPGDHFPSPAAIPADYYDNIYRYIRRDEPVMYMEIGWPTTGKGNENSQLQFVHRLPALMENVRPKVLAWSLLHDVRFNELSGELASTGLASREGRAKAAFMEFKALKNK